MATNRIEETLQEKFGPGWKLEKGSWRLNPDERLDVRSMTQRMLGLDARFVAISSLERPDHEIRLDYHWDLDGELVTFELATWEKKIDTIVDLSPAVDWAERETREYYGVEFVGRESTEPLMMRAGDPIGVHLRTEEAKA